MIGNSQVKATDCEEMLVADVIKSRRSALRNKDEVSRFILKIIAFVIIVLLMLGVVFGLKPMSDMSMHPRISPRDIVLYYRFNITNQVSKVMVYENRGQELVGRIVAKPGDTVEVKEKGGLYVNGSIVSETNIFYETKPYEGDVKYPIKLGSDEYFLLSDYRDGSKDSRYFGPVKESDLKGEVIAVIRKSGL